jgi:hypothetical protein
MGWSPSGLGRIRISIKVKRNAHGELVGTSNSVILGVRLTGIIGVGAVGLKFSINASVEPNKDPSPS